MSRSNFERRIEELKQDSAGDEQATLIRGIYVLRKFCIEKRTNIMMVSEEMMQQEDQIRASAILGQDDLLIQWPKPKWQKGLSYSKEVSRALPDKLVLRQIKVTVSQPGFRVSSFYIVTTLIDAETYSAKDLADLYYRRWAVELFFRDIKTTMGMDILRCRTPMMVRKEIQMHFIVYNTIRLLMLNAAKQADLPPRCMSFKASFQALRQWEPILNRKYLGKHERKNLTAAGTEPGTSKTP